MVSSIITHNIDPQTYAKLGEIILRWAEADGFLGNSINWMSGFTPESAEAMKVYKFYGKKDKIAGERSGSSTKRSCK